MRAAVVVVVALAGTAMATETDDLAAIQAAGADCDSGRAHCIGIHLHVARDDTGFVATPDSIARALAAAHRHFGAIDVDFKIVAIDALPASALHVVTRHDRDELAADRMHPKVIDVFMVGRLDDIDHERPFIYGVTWRAKDGRKFIIVSNAARERTLAHELGHFFGLPHSTYPVSIMNKTDRAEPPDALRTFADEEIAAMKPALKRLLRDHVIEDR